MRASQHTAAPDGAGRSPPPYRGRSRMVAGCTGGGGVHLGCGFRRPNSESEFGASVMVTPPYGSNAGSAQRTGRRVVGPYERQGEPHQPPGTAAWMGGLGGNRSRDHPQSVHQLRAIPQSRLRRASSLYTREPFPAGDGGCGLPCRFAPRNDSPDPLSFRGGPTGRRGNPSFLRWTMDGGSGRRGRRPLRKARSTTQASRRAAKRPRQRPRGMGGNRRWNHQKGTSFRDCRGSA